MAEMKKPMDKPVDTRAPKTEGLPPTPMRKPRIFIMEARLRNAIINLIGAGSYDTAPPVPSRDVVQIVRALSNLRPFTLTQEPPKAEAGKKAPPAPPPIQVFLLDENLRNIVVNLLGAGTFSRIPVMEVIRVISTLNALRPFDVNIKNEAKAEEKKEEPKSPPAIVKDNKSKKSGERDSVR